MIWQACAILFWSRAIAVAVLQRPDGLQERSVSKMRGEPVEGFRLRRNFFRGYQYPGYDVRDLTNSHLGIAPRASLCTLQRGAGSIESPYPATKPVMPRASSSQASSICRILCFLLLVFAASEALDQDDILAKAAPGAGKSTRDTLVATLEKNFIRSLDEVKRHGPGGGAGKGAQQQLSEAEVHDGMGGGGVAEATLQPQVDPDPLPDRIVVGCPSLSHPTPSFSF
jgi:hypothetical protein